MAFYFYIWTNRAESKIAAHGVTREEFEDVVETADRVEPSRSSADRLIAIGQTPAGRRLCCVFEIADFDIVVPITAYDV